MCSFIAATASEHPSVVLMKVLLQPGSSLNVRLAGGLKVVELSLSTDGLLVVDGGGAVVDRLHESYPERL